MIHPNLVKRPKRTRSTMKGAVAYYVPKSLLANNDVKAGSQVNIIRFEINPKKEYTFAVVLTKEGTEAVVLFSDLAFVNL